MSDLLALARNYGPADNIDRRRARDLAHLLNAYEKAQGIAHALMGDAVVTYLKRIPGWRSPYSFFRRTNSPQTWTLVSYHHRVQLCWEWSIWLTIGARAMRTLKPWRWFHHSARQTSFGIPFLFDITLHRQSYGYMVSGDAKQLIQIMAAARTDAQATCGGGFEHEGC